MTAPTLGAISSAMAGSFTIGVATSFLANFIKGNEMNSIIETSGNRLEAGHFNDTGDWVDRPGEWIDKVLPGVPLYGGFLISCRVNHKLYSRYFSEILSSKRIPRVLLWRPPLLISAMTGAITGPALVTSGLQSTYGSFDIRTEEYFTLLAVSVPVAMVTVGAVLFPAVFVSNLFGIAMLRVQLLNSGKQMGMKKFGSRVLK